MGVISRGNRCETPARPQGCYYHVLGNMRTPFALLLLYEQTEFNRVEIKSVDVVSQFVPGAAEESNKTTAS